MNGFELSCQLTYLNDSGKRETLCGVAGVTLTKEEVLDSKTDAKVENTIIEALDELFIQARRCLNKNLAPLQFKNMHGIASHNLRHLADLMDNDPDFKVTKATEYGRTYMMFDLPDKEPR